MNNIGRHPNCSMRTEIGNCDPIGGFCTSVNENVCDALHKVSRPTGEWIHDGVDVEGGVDWMHCSNCGKSDVWADATRTNFCPNCGARMKGGAE